MTSCPLKQRTNRLFKILLLISWSNCLYAHEVSLFAPINGINLVGNLTFYQQSENSPVQISISLNYVRQPKQPDHEEKFEWSILSNPVSFGNGPNSCNRNELGRTEFELHKKHGEITMTNNGTTLSFVNHELSLQGKASIWSKSVFIKSLSSNAKETCTNILDTKGDVKTAEAKFVGEISGLVVFRENERGETLIYSNLYYTSDDYKSSSKNDWKIYTTDIFDRKTTRSCHYLSLLLDPFNVKDDDCSPDNHLHCKMGDLTRKHKQLTIGAQNNRFSKQIFFDLSLPISFVEGSSRSFFLVIMDKNNNQKIFACAKLNMIRSKEVKAIIDQDGVQGYFHFQQRHSLDPTIVSIKLNNLQKRGKFYSINEYPLKPIVYKSQSACDSTGSIYNPTKIQTTKQAAQQSGTNDEYAIGDLSGKFGVLNSFERNYLAIYTDFNLPLFGLNSIIGRSIVIRNADDKNWICSNIGYPTKLLTAIATFYFPVYGRLVLRQELDKPYAETTVLAELNYSDGQLNNTMNHDWKLHENFAGRDFYNWSRRCDSTGQIYNPVKIGQFKYNQKCNKDNPMNCKIGDLAMKAGQKLSIIADSKSDPLRVFYTDVNLPLQGTHSVIGRSIVIMDDQAPKQRGNRLACATIFRNHDLTASVREWKTSVGIKSNVSGSVTFNQETIFDPTEVKINLHGLNGLASNYHMHEIWVARDKLFPCSYDSVGAYYNPFELDSSVGVLPGAGSKDQYEVGDLSGKYGPLTGKTHEKKDILDTSLTLHGLHSIVGRSFVINKQERNFQWTCGTIKSEIRKDEGRELIALASFHNEKDEIEGFIRFKQLEYKDGSLSSTWVESSLKHAGDFNRNKTQKHKWAVYVNQVGADAYISAKNVRCLAGGYRWNPYLVESKSDRYAKDCNIQSQLRCEMGDLSGKLGELAIGDKPKIFVDENLPLIGNFSVMFRSLIIFDKDGSENNKIACANILPDIQLIGSVTVKKNPSFTVEKFMNHMRKQLNTKKWLVEADIANTNYQILKGDCVQITVRFYGSEAHRLQIEFSNLLNLGSVVRQANGRQETVHTFYKPCKSLDDLTEEGLNGSNLSNQLSFLIGLFAFLCNLVFLI